MEFYRSTIIRENPDGPTVFMNGSISFSVPQKLAAKHINMLLDWIEKILKRQTAIRDIAFEEKGE